MRRNFGFTLIELMIVIVVIAILAAVSSVTYRGVVERANDAAIKTAAKQWSQILELAIMEGTVFSAGYSCLGSSASNFPANDKYPAGVCYKNSYPDYPMYNDDVQYDAAFMGQFTNQTDGKSGLLPHVAQKSDSSGWATHYEGRGVYIRASTTPIRQINMYWVPARPGDCAFGRDAWGDGGQCVWTKRY